MMRSVERILAVFESFSAERSSLSLQEISERIELPKSTTFRIVQSLERAGYLVRLEDQQYCLSFRFTRLAGLVRGTLGIREIARPFMTELAETTKETVSLHTVSGSSRICIDSISTVTAPLRAVVQAGEQIPLQAGSGSKVLMAYMSKADLTPLLPAAMKATKQSKAAFLEELRRIRENGYAVSHGERLMGISAISAPIVGVDGQVHYCLSVGAPTVRMQMHEKNFIKLVVTAAANISRQFGGKTE
ncbi:IclR family transcriptional regulator [Burkholderia multivorans]|uniref:IclR family transcriptional regulator n=2 Tax=Burkholderia multivorans TaxID=87883 RepID=A0AAP2HH46_9BURK|nr:IclR family transcriptional regulator [Burkholderia multivorans]MBH9664524.1 IclR family transcriptional regulator [Burkholderia multivorans]MBU9356142.1 IclR family transcriptional regulator [Burkholderia multivorans]MBU9366589.1 IclR family transcriptional regulator [Burkholderia multivorans]MBU9597112.1 IclR family transcriptional regulator [Burkholderia multivorans]MBU9651180.1 IclR family transcriptional regulator [Burkholderia multivorans]